MESRMQFKDGEIERLSYEICEKNAELENMYEEN